VSISSRSVPAGHRRRPAPRTPLRHGVDLLARAGGLVSLAALLVLGVALAGAVDGTPGDGGQMTVRSAEP
jgi:hypothetical protein